MTPQKAIEKIKWIMQNKSHNKELCNICIEALEKQIPKQPKHIHEEHKSHQWKRDRDGNIDEYAFEYEYHSGVKCERCGKTQCIYCEPDYDKGTCTIDIDVCPHCGVRVDTWRKPGCCDTCGQKINWSDINDTK